MKATQSFCRNYSIRSFFLILNFQPDDDAIWSVTFPEFEHITNLHHDTGGKIPSTEAPLLGWPPLPLLLGPSLEQSSRHNDWRRLWDFSEVVLLNHPC